MLQVADLEVAYDDLQVLFGLSLSVNSGEILCLLGRNGAGKTTTLKSIMGLLPLRSGSVHLAGENIGQMPPHIIPRQGIAYVPQGRGLFSELTVAQNLEIGLMVRGTSLAVRENVLTLFPRLRERYKQRAETLSGGEQQMLAMARAMCMEPRVILLDEPTEGLQPSMISLVRDVILTLKENNVAVVLVEQHVKEALAIADRVSFVEHGRIPETVLADDLDNDAAKLRQYMGVY